MRREQKQIRNELVGAALQPLQIWGQLLGGSERCVAYRLSCNRFCTRYRFSCGWAMGKSSKEIAMDAQARQDWKDCKQERLTNANITKIACKAEFLSASKKVASCVKTH